MAPAQIGKAAEVAVGGDPLAARLDGQRGQVGEPIGLEYHQSLEEEDAGLTQDADPSTGLAAQVGYVGDANVASFLFQNAVIGLLTPDDAVQLETTADGVVNLQDTLQIPVSPGDQFYLVASSAATAEAPAVIPVSVGPTSQGAPARRPRARASRCEGG